MGRGLRAPPIVQFSGHFLPLSTHPRNDWNDLWLLTRIEHEGKQPQVLEESVTSQSESNDGFTQGYRNCLTATPWDVPFRPALEHPKPRILGSQTAKVTGPAGEEIHCDQYGRVKVQFHWDRDGQADDATSCWLRVSSSWAGDRYGAIAIPRVGMEVLVTFLEGDPDQPLITGCLFHKEHVVPYDLPANKSRSVFKTLSSPGGEGFNELRIEDKKGAEQIFLHAQRDWDENIERDQKIRVGNQRHETVEANSYSEFKAEEHRTTHLDRKSEIKASDHLTIGQNQQVKIGTGQFISAGQEIVARVEQSPEKIQEQLAFLMRTNQALKIRHIEFDIFGFSRGAAAARHFANEVLKPAGGLLAATLNEQTLGLLPGFDWAVNARINFIGLFDTVAAIVDVSRDDFSPANERNPGVNLYLPPGCARKVLQLAARDEQRENFALNSVAPQHQEIRLPGMHSDLGGGYRSRMTEKLLISQPRSVLVTPGRPLEHSSAWRETQMAIGQLEQRGLPGEGEIKPVHKYFATTGQHGNNSQSQRAIVAASIKREVRGELSRVYMRIMRALAVKHEVPFKEIPDNTSFAIPSDLQAIAEKITAGAMGQGERLSTAQERHLHARYIHLSAHWTPSKRLLINKPAKQRQVYRNSPQGGYPE